MTRDEADEVALGQMCQYHYSFLRHLRVVKQHTPRRQLSFQNGRVTELGKTLHVLYGTRRFITVYKKAPTYPLS